MRDSAESTFETEAIAQLRKRSLWFIAIGAMFLWYCLYELINLY